MMELTKMELTKYGLRHESASEFSSYSVGGKSCEFSTHSSGCIEKARINLSLLKTQLLQWQKDIVQFKHNIQEQQEMKLLHFSEPDRRHEHKLLEVIKSGSELEICGVSLEPSSEHEVEKIVDTIQKTVSIEQRPNKHFLVIENVTAIIDRLEADRSIMADLLVKEQERCKMLRDSIDKFAYQRIHDLPKAVQDEHERCAYDLQELRWHCEYKGRIEERVKEKVRISANINKKIHEEIQFVVTNRPLIEDKLEAENKAMKTVKWQQTDINLRVNAASKELKKIETSFDYAKRKADTESRSLAKQVLDLSNELQEALNSQLDARTKDEQMCNNSIQLKAFLETLEESLAHFEKKRVQLAEYQVVLEQKVKNKEEDIEKATALFKQLTDQNNEFTETIHEKNLQLSEINSKYDKELKNKTTQLQKILRKNKNCSKDIQMLKKKIENCEQQKRNDAKAIQRALTEKNKIFVDLKVIKEESFNMRSIHEQLILKLDKERIHSAEVEENLGIQHEALRRQCKEEAHARVILQSRITGEQAEFAKTKEESEGKRAKLIKAEADIKKTLTTVQVQVDKLSKICDERKQVGAEVEITTISEIDGIIEQVTTRHKTAYDQYTSEINKLSPEEQACQNKARDLSEKLDHIDQTGAEINKKLMDMASSSVMMAKILLAHEKAIAELHDEVKELELQISTGEDLESKLQNSLTELTGRSSYLREDHDSQMHERSIVLDELKAKLFIALEENKGLAKEYTVLQNQHIAKKNGFIISYEKALIAQEILDDKKSLCDLHNRLHEALECYYQLRGIQTRTGLTKFERMTRSNYQKLNRIQNDLQTATRNISEFLKANNKSHKLIEMQNSALKKTRRTTVVKTAT